VMEDRQKLSDISTSHDVEGFRSLGTPGYEEAVEYVESPLQATGGFDVERQAFEVEQPTLDPVEGMLDRPELEVTPASLTEGTTEPLTDLPVVLPVDDDYGDLAGGQLGCEAADYDESAEGALVLAVRGTCSFGEKTQADTDAG